MVTDHSISPGRDDVTHHRHYYHHFIQLRSQGPLSTFSREEEIGPWERGCILFSNAGYKVDLQLTNNI